MIFLVVSILLLIPFHVGLWKLFEKAGRKGWESIIPVYDLYVIQKITGKPAYWVIAALFPGINLIVLYTMVMNLYKSFGKESNQDMTLGVLAFFYFTPKWGFDSSVKYIRPEDLPIQPKSQVRDWLEAAVFAIVAATIIKTYTFEAYKIPTSSMEENLLIGDFLFVSKLNYGPRIPMHPLTFPFTHNKFSDIPIPGLPSVKSYVNWLSIPYTRIPGWQKIKNDDIVVFNFPEGDTVIVDPRLESMSYYNEARGRAEAMWREDGNPNKPKSINSYMPKAYAEIKRKYDLRYHPADKRENYIKRCVGIAGDILEIKESQVYINGKPQQNLDNLQHMYLVTGGARLNRKKLRDMGVTKEDIQGEMMHGIQLMNLSEKQAKEIAKMSGILEVEKFIHRPDSNRYNPVIFPHSEKFIWTLDNFGPLEIPKKGNTIKLTTDNLPIYQRAISTYEGHTVEVKNEVIYIDGKPATSYTFGMDYYFMMGDNRHMSLDSRYWGFVPEDHVVGKASMIWMSSGEEGIRWKRIFKLI